jgi:hypothetical protein
MRGGEAIHQRFPHLANYDENWTAVYEPDGGTLLAENCLNAIQVKKEGRRRKEEGGRRKEGRGKELI